MMRVGGELICCRRIERFLSERTWRRSVVGESLCIWRGGYKVSMNSPTRLNIVSLRILKASKRWSRRDEARRQPVAPAGDTTMK